MNSGVKAIAERTGCTVEQVLAVAELVLEALHEASVKTEQVPGGILTEPAWMFSPKVCYHLNGVLWEYLVHHPDERSEIYETMLRFRADEWVQFKPLVEKWESERSDGRRELDKKSADDLEQ